MRIRRFAWVRFAGLWERQCPILGADLEAAPSPANRNCLTGRGVKDSGAGCVFPPEGRSFAQHSRCLSDISFTDCAAEISACATTERRSSGAFPLATVTTDSVDVLNRDTIGISRQPHMVVPDRLIAGGMNAALTPGVVTVTLAAGKRATGPSPLRHQAIRSARVRALTTPGLNALQAADPDPPNRYGHFREHAFSGASARYDS